MKRSEQRARAESNSLGSLGPVAAMRKAKSEKQAIRIGVEAMRIGFRLDVIVEGLVAYLERNEK